MIIKISKIVKGYKIFGPNYTCRGYKYSSKNIYQGDLKMCISGFHFCPKVVDCLMYYNCTPENTYVEVIGKDCIIEYDKVLYKELTIKPISREEFMKACTGVVKTYHKGTRGNHILMVKYMKKPHIKMDYINFGMIMVSYVRQPHTKW